MDGAGRAKGAVLYLKSPRVSSDATKAPLGHATQCNIGALKGIQDKASEGNARRSGHDAPCSEHTPLGGSAHAHRPQFVF